MVEALKSVHSTFPVCFPHVDAVTARQWSMSPCRCASRAPVCCRAGLAVCCGNSHGHCRVRPPLLQHGHATLSPALRAAVLPSHRASRHAYCHGRHPCTRIYAAMLCALAQFDFVHVVAPTVVTPLMALRRTGQASVNTRVLVR